MKTTRKTEQTAAVSHCLSRLRDRDRMIARRAFELARLRCSSAGIDWIDWLRAELEFLGRMRQPLPQPIRVRVQTDET
jgi:hypothetical protein